MRIFTILLLLLNLGYFAWHNSSLAERDSSPVVVRSASQQAPQRLQLLSEVPAEQLPEAAQEQNCISIGVFASTADSDDFLSRLLTLGLPAQVRLEEVDELPDYWVHMPPFVSEAAARRRLQELQANAIDSYLIAGGELAQGISLGLFSRRESALLVQEQLAAQGFPSSIMEVPRSYTQIWVDIQGLTPQVRGQSQWLALLDQFPGLQQVEKLCETIAPKP